MDEKVRREKIQTKRSRNSGTLGEKGNSTAMSGTILQIV